MEIITINDVLTAAEAAKVYELNQPSLRQRLERGKAFIYGVDCRKAETGKHGEWLVTREAIERVYAKKPQG